MPVSADFLLLLYTEDRSLREALAVLTKERGWTLCAPEERCSREPSCILTDLDGKTGSYSGNDFGDLPKYTVSFFEEKHPTLLRPFSEERFAALLGSARNGGEGDGNRRGKRRGKSRLGRRPARFRHIVFRRYVAVSCRNEDFSVEKRAADLRASV